MQRIQKQTAISGAILFILAFVFSLQAQPQRVKEVEDRLMKQADENIEKYRKGDVSVRFITNDGKPLQGAAVEVVQKTHDFLFGCIIFDLIRDENPYRQELFKQ